MFQRTHDEEEVRTETLSRNRKHQQESKRACFERSNNIDDDDDDDSDVTRLVLHLQHSDASCSSRCEDNKVSLDVRASRSSCRMYHMTCGEEAARNNSSKIPVHIGCSRAVASSFEVTSRRQEPEKSIVELSRKQRILHVHDGEIFGFGRYYD